MWKLGLVLLGCIIFALFILFGNASDMAGTLTQILLPALAAILIIVIAISVAPWLSNRGR